MHEITLEWLEAGQIRVSKQVIGLKHPSSIKLGRNPDICRIVFTQQDPTISRQHAEIFYNDDDNTLYLRKLPEGLCPPTVDRKMIYSDAVPLHLFINNLQFLSLMDDKNCKPQCCLKCKILLNVLVG